MDSADLLLMSRPEVRNLYNEHSKLVRKAVFNFPSFYHSTQLGTSSLAVKDAADRVLTSTNAITNILHKFDIYAFKDRLGSIISSPVSNLSSLRDIASITHSISKVHDQLSEVVAFVKTLHITPPTLGKEILENAIGTTAPEQLSSDGGQSDTLTLPTASGDVTIAPIFAVYGKDLYLYLNIPDYAKITSAFDILLVLTHPTDSLRNIQISLTYDPTQPAFQSTPSFFSINPEQWEEFLSWPHYEAAGVAGIAEPRAHVLLAISHVAITLKNYLSPPSVTQTQPSTSVVTPVTALPLPIPVGLSTHTAPRITAAKVASSTPVVVAPPPPKSAVGTFGTKKSSKAAAAASAFIPTTPDKSAAVLVTATASGSSKSSPGPYVSRPELERKEAVPEEEEDVTHYIDTAAVQNLRSMLQSWQAGNVPLKDLNHYVDNVDLRARDSALHTPLMTACYYKCPAAVKRMLQHGAPVNARNADGKTALMVAVERGDYECCELLVNARADVNAVDKRGKVPVINALLGFSAKKDISAMLIRNGARLDSINEQDDGKSAAAYAFTQMYAGGEEVVNAVLESKQPIPYHIIHHNGDNLLGHIAQNALPVKLWRKLLSQPHEPKDINYINPKNNRSVLYYLLKPAHKLSDGYRTHSLAQIIHELLAHGLIPTSADRDLAERHDDPRIRELVAKAKRR